MFPKEIVFIKYAMEVNFRRLYSTSTPKHFKSRVCVSFGEMKPAISQVLKQTG